MKKTSYNEPRSITVAELCQALADGAIPAQMEDGMYVVRSMDLKRYVNPTLRLPITTKVPELVLQRAS